MLPSYPIAIMLISRSRFMRDGLNLKDINEHKVVGADLPPEPFEKCVATMAHIVAFHELVRLPAMSLMYQMSVAILIRYS